LRITGGGAKSATMRQIVSDIFGLPVVGFKVGEGAALGAAIQAGWYAKGDNFVAMLPDFFKAGLDDALSCITPGLRILFDMAPRQTVDKRMRRAGLSENFSGIGLEHETLAGGCLAIETEA